MLTACRLSQCHYLLHRKFCVTSYSARLETFVEHILGGLKNAFQNAFFHGILNRIIVITQIFHIRLIVTKFNFTKITNFRNLKHGSEELIVKFWRDFIQFVQVCEQIEPQVAGRFALHERFLKPCEHGKGYVYEVVPFSVPLDIGKLNVPNNTAVLIFGGRLVVEKTKRVNFWVVEFIVPALFDKDCNGLTYIKEQPAKKMVLLGDLHFRDEPVSTVVRAVQVKYSGSLFSCFVDLLVWVQHDIFNFLLQEFPEECLYEGDELGLVAFPGEDSFKCEIDEKRSKANRLCKLVWGNSDLLGHNASFVMAELLPSNSCNKIAPLCGKIENCFREAA